MCDFPQSSVLPFFLVDPLSVEDILCGGHRSPARLEGGPGQLASKPPLCISLTLPSFLSSPRDTERC